MVNICRFTTNSAGNEPKARLVTSLSQRPALPPQVRTRRPAVFQCALCIGMGKKLLGSKKKTNSAVPN
jgi:hypothetical protein